jgi:hypothetical protein
LEGVNDHGVEAGASAKSFEDEDDYDEPSLISVKLPDRKVFKFV